jgi:hypothetical protein
MADETASESANTQLVVPSHGRGALLPGGKPGNKGGGRTPSALRRKALKKGPKMLKVLEDIALSADAKDSDKVAAAKEHLRIGMGTAYSEIEVADKVQACVMAAERILPEELAAQYIFELRRIWLGR